MTSSLVSADYDWLVTSPKLDLLLDLVEQDLASWLGSDLRELLST